MDSYSCRKSDSPTEWWWFRPSDDTLASDYPELVRRERGGDRDDGAHWLTGWAEEGAHAMGCLFALLAGVAPRIALVFVWIFTNLVDRAYTGFVIPLLGLIFFPYATLFYVLAYNPVTGVGGWGRVFVIIGFVFDIGHWVGGGVTGRRQYAT